MRFFHAKCVRITLAARYQLGFVLAILAIFSAERIQAELAFQLLCSFNANSNISYPSTPLMRHNDGGFYGVAGSNVFRIEPGGSPFYICSLPRGSGDVSGALIELPDGNLYGTALSQRYTFPFTGNDIIFKIDQSHTAQALIAFHGTNYPYGAEPVAGLVRAHDGTLYGSTFANDYRGVVGPGTLYQVHWGDFLSVGSFSLAAQMAGSPPLDWLKQAMEISTARR